MYHTLTNESLSVTFQDGSTYTILRSDPNFDAACRMVLEKNWEGLRPKMSVKDRLTAWAREAGFGITENHITYQGEAVPEAINKRIFALMSRGEDIAPMLRFYQRLSNNPSWRSVQQLYTFLEHCGIPVTEDGTFLAYKSVRRNYLDHHSGTVNNTPGAEISYPRNKISDDPNVPCHEGLHVGALSYAKTFRGDSRIIICEIDPSDVVCIPYDCSNQKMRVCRYKVIGNYGTQLDDVLHDKDDNPPVAPSKPVDAYGLKAKPVEVTDIESLAFDLPAAEEPEPADLGVDDSEWAYLRGIKEEDELLKQNLQHLRKFARHDLKIVGASKIPGGKVALVQHILGMIR